jgi:hypothetical protein
VDIAQDGVEEILRGVKSSYMSTGIWEIELRQTGRDSQSTDWERHNALVYYNTLDSLGRHLCSVWRTSGRLGAVHSLSWRNLVAHQYHGLRWLH